MKTPPTKKQMAWACRRGMLELDLIFGPFVERGGYEALPVDDQLLFYQFLQEPDPVLFAWLMGHEVPSAPEYQRMAALLQG